MKTIGYFCLCLICLATFAQAQEIKMSDPEKAVVQIVVQKIDGSFVPIGTGFFVEDSGTIVTAAHVYGKGISLIAEGRGGILLARRANRASKKYTVARIELFKTDYLHDLVSFKMQEVNTELWGIVGGIRSLLLSKLNDIEPNALVRVIGYFGVDLYPLTVTARLVGATAMTVAPGNTVEEFLVSAAAVPGQSGSPVVLEDESVIGVITSIVPVTVPFNPNPLTLGLNRVIKVEHIQRLLSSK